MKLVYFGVLMSCSSGGGWAVAKPASWLPTSNTANKHRSLEECVLGSLWQVSVTSYGKESTMLRKLICGTLLGEN